MFYPFYSLFMDCDKIREIIPQYVAHNSSEEDTRIIEEHLCVCEGCRKYLGGLLDTKEYHPREIVGETTIEPLEKHKKVDFFIIAILIIAIGVVLFSLYLIFKV